MKKRIFELMFFILFLCIALLNFNLGKLDNNGSDLMLANVEALAQESNPWYQWLTQGLTKDEITVEIPCTVTTSTTTTSPGGSVNVNITIPVNGVPVGVSGGVTAGGVVKVVNNQYQGTKIECPDGGTTNCTPKDCS